MPPNDGTDWDQTIADVLTDDPDDYPRETAWDSSVDRVTDGTGTHTRTHNLGNPYDGGGPMPDSPKMPPGRAASSFVDDAGYSFRMDPDGSFNLVDGPNGLKGVSVRKFRPGDARYAKVLAVLAAQPGQEALRNIKAPPVHRPAPAKPAPAKPPPVEGGDLGEVGLTADGEEVPLDTPAPSKAPAPPEPAPAQETIPEYLMAYPGRAFDAARAKVAKPIAGALLEARDAWNTPVPTTWKKPGE